MTDATKPEQQKPRPGTAHNPFTELMIEEAVAAHPELSREKCIELLIKPPAVVL